MLGLREQVSHLAPLNDQDARYWFVEPSISCADHGLNSLYYFLRGHYFSLQIFAQCPVTLSFPRLQNHKEWGFPGFFYALKVYIALFSSAVIHLRHSDDWAAEVTSNFGQVPFRPQTAYLAPQLLFL